MESITLSLDQLRQLLGDTFRGELSSFAATFKPSDPAQTDVQYLTRKQTACRLGVSLVTLNDWTKTGKVQGYRIGSRVRYKASEIDGALKAIVTSRKR